MGSCLSVSISCDQLVNQVSQCLSVNGSYIYNLSENLAAMHMHKEMEVIKAKRDDVQARVSREEFTGSRQMLAKVQVWLKNVLDIENHFNDLLSTSPAELQSSQGDFDVVTEGVHVSEVEEIPIPPTIVCHETLLEKVGNRLMEDGVGVLDRCKVALTARPRDVCGRMEVEDLIEVCCLCSDKAWELFQKKVGERTLKIHADIPDLVKQVAGKCSGLPLALNVIGETMSCKSTVQEWRHVMDVLTLSAADFSGMKDEILPILKYSYDSVNGEMKAKVEKGLLTKYMRSNKTLDMTLLKELQLLEYLENLTIEVRSGFVLDQLLSSPLLVKCIRKIERTTPCFQSLSQVDICVCYRIKDLTWLVFAPNLVDLGVKYSNQLEEIISKEKAGSVTGGLDQHFRMSDAEKVSVGF
ncbi:hypothetical protein DY000_02055715 [Brassica cretica]|uniref:NB-ARC domain-containing protein n=1 Tax=Brassica cretica TaxID=69181 RepID=A0ABQ7A872_BRACR|nr:hypothetical protein DY000_02055715 [Brassica cretica]